MALVYVEAPSLADKPLRLRPVLQRVGTQFARLEGAAAAGETAIGLPLRLLRGKSDLDLVEVLHALSGLKLPKGKAKAIEVLARGVARTYGRAVRALEAATASGHTEDWHDLRKRIKYHRMHVQLMSPAWPGDMALRAQVADLAGEALGDDHDLDALETLLATDPDTIGDEAEIAVLRAVMAARSVELHDQVRDIVRNLLRDDRNLVQSRIAALWRDAV